MSWDVGDYYDASFAVHKCRRYHARLRDFYRNAHNVVLIANIVAASGTFVAILGSLPALAAILSAIVALASLFDYVFATERTADLYADLCRRFTQLAADMETWEASTENLQRARAERLRIECDEPSLKRLVDLWAKREEERARGVEEARLVPLTWAQRTFGCLFTFGLGRLERWRAKNHHSM